MSHLSHLEPGVSFVLMHLAFELAHGEHAAPHFATAATFTLSIVEIQSLCLVDTTVIPEFSVRAVDGKKVRGGEIIKWRL